jgi:glycosyltransferase involved in cell wall biosynthesis
MRVVHVDLGREMRGGQRQALHLIEELQRRGVEQRFLSPHGEPFSPWKLLTLPADLIHVHDARAHTLAALFSRAPIVVSRRVAFAIRRGWASAWKYGRAALYLAVSRYVADRLMTAGVPAERIEIVYDGVAPLPRSTRDGPIIAPATDDPMKGSDLIRASGVDVTFTNDLTEALKSARAMLYITREEGLGSAALLAMSAGVPVIASRTGGLVEIVDDGVDGRLVENDPSAIARAVNSLEDSVLREWSERARAKVHGRFLTSHMADATLSAYRRLLRT